MATTYTLKRKYFADANQIAELERKIQAGKAAGKDVSSLERALARIGGENANLAKGAETVAVQAGSGANATTVMSKNATKEAIEEAGRKATNRSNLKNLKNSASTYYKNLSRGGKAGVILGGTALVAAPIVAGVAGKKSGEKRAAQR